ncbi:MAG: YaaR family protein [bacterium]
MSKTSERSKTSRAGEGYRSAGTHSSGRVGEVKRASFAETLQVSKDTVVREELDRILAEIDKQGAIFIENPVAAELLRYKDLVRQFMREVVENMYDVRETVSGRYSIRQKIYVIVNTVDRKLEDLTEALLERQAEALDLMSRIDEIRGLLLDLYG